MAISFYLLSALFQICPAAMTTNAFLANCQALTRDPHRLAGTEEEHRAAKYIEKELHKIGIEQVLVQEFLVPQVRVKRCTIEIANGDESKTTTQHPLLPMRSCGIVPPVTPPEGITGHLLYAGTGNIEDFKNHSPQDAIVVLDYNSDDAWRRAFRLGAKAVIYVRNAMTHSRFAHYTEASVNLPRFYYPGNAHDLQVGGRATIHSKIVWENRIGHNVLAFLPGTKPIFHLEKEEMIVLAANLDSFGEIPELSPGARGAANCAALLQLARYFQINRPRRHILLAFFDAQARGHAGASAFYKALQTDIKEVLPEARHKSIDAENTFLTKLVHALAQRTSFVERSDIHRPLVRLVSQKAEIHAHALSTMLALSRQKAQKLNRKDPARKSLETQIQEQQKHKDEWNDLQRALNRNEDTQPWHNKMIVITDEVRQDAKHRMAELVIEQRALNSDEALRNLIKLRWIILHISSLLGDTSPSWGVVVGGDSDVHSVEDKPGLYGKVLASFNTACNDLDREGIGPRHFIAESVDGSLTSSRLLVGAPAFVHSGEVAGKSRIYNLVLATCEERLPREGTPDDIITNLNLKRVQDQTADIIRLLPAVVNSERLSTRSSIVASQEYYISEFREDNQPHGPRALGKDPASSLFNKPMENATIQIFGKRLYPGLMMKHIPGFENFQTVLADYNGAYSYSPILKNRREQSDGFAALFDERGMLSWASTSATASTVKTRLNMIKAYHGAVVLPPQQQPQAVKVMSALANSPLDIAKAYVKTFDGIAYWYCEEKIKAVKLFNPDAVVALVNGPETLQNTTKRAKSGGVGFAIDQGWIPFNSAMRSATDLWRLDETRMQIQRSRSIMNSSVEELHGRVQDSLIEAASTKDMKKKDALAISSFWSEKPVYEHTRNALNDLVKAVLVLLALSVPFAFALERLAIGATTIYRQLSGFVAFFVITFFILYLSHPAFAISNTPLIIFLGFAIVVLSSLVIFIVMRRFEVELKVLQGLTSTVHTADVSRFSTLMAAMSMGISTMRRRPIRTVLTALTIILLTFTILCFASFDLRLGVVRLFDSPLPRYAGVFFNDMNWAPLHPDTVAVIEGCCADDSPVCSRYWFSPSQELNKGLLVTCKDGTHPVILSAALGIDPEELKYRADLASVINGADLKDGILMTRAAIDRLGVEEGATVLVGGVPLRVGKVLDDVRIADVQDINDSSILPVDFSIVESTKVGEKEHAAIDTMLQSKGRWSHLPVDSIAIVSTETARRLGGQLHGIAIYTKNTKIAGSLADRLARILQSPVSATRKDGVYLHNLGPILAASGARDLFFPILLGGLVVFGTMLGSVTDREREIYTFSALGLAPPHVASLFFAEAMVYSVLGGLGGYLLAQGSVKILSYLANFGLFTVPEMNYSSTNAIFTILIVMGTVLLSTIYPAIKASRSANPGLLRMWRLPAPDGNMFKIAFPFTVSEYDITGVVSFLKEHFDNFSDVGLGVFRAREARLIRYKDNSIGLQAELALAPFDLGVTESFNLRSLPSEIAGIDVVYIELTRRSGQPRDWRRLNKTLLDDLRRQFLIWRALPHETIEIYRQRTLLHMKANG